MFLLSSSADTAGITTMGELEVSPSQIVRRFGPPQPDDGYKVSGQYVFTDENGEVFVVHGWKATSLWDPTFPMPAEYWASEEPDEISTSSRDGDINNFQNWFVQQLAR
jgi:hypothetical protein